MKSGLLVGINYIGTEYELKGCINDTTNINNFLLSIGYLQNNIRILTDNTIEKPTRNNIINYLKNMVDKAIAGDELFFLYSGHGTLERDISGDEVETKNDSALVPIDFIVSKLILDDEIREILSKLKKGVRMTIILDCCNSGTCCDLKYNYRDLSYNKKNADLRNYKSIEWVTQQKKIINNNYSDCAGDIFMISGCGDLQTSSDTSFNGIPSGALTGILLMILAEYKNVLSWSTLLKDLNRRLKLLNYTQRPRLSSGKNINLNLSVFLTTRPTNNNRPTTNNNNSLTTNNNGPTTNNNNRPTNNNGPATNNNNSLTTSNNRPINNRPTSNRPNRPNRSDGQYDLSHLL